jgi:hypothetical protein
MSKYERKTWRDRDRRMANAVRFRAQGMSLREIAARQNVHHQTVANDLERWKSVRHEMPPAIIRLSIPAVESLPAADEISTPGFDGGAIVIPLRRSA